MSKPSRRPVSIARRAISTGVWPATIGRLGTPARSPSWASWSCAAGRWVSRLASSTRLRSRSVSRSPSLPAVVVLPEPCSPTIRKGIGAGAFNSSGTAPSPPSSSIITSLTIFTTCWPGVTESSTSEASARCRTLPMKSRTTGRATSESSRASRTSRSASPTSASLSAPRPRRRSKVPVSFSDSASNKVVTPNQNAPLREPSRSGGAPARSEGQGVAATPPASSMRCGEARSSRRRNASRGSPANRCSGHQIVLAGSRDRRFTSTNR